MKPEILVESNYEMFFLAQSISLHQKDERAVKQTEAASKTFLFLMNQPIEETKRCISFFLVKSYTYLSKRRRTIYAF